MAFKLSHPVRVGLLLCFFVFENIQANPEVQSSSPFQAGLLAYQKKDYQEARQLFMEVWKSQPEDAAALTNLGLASYQLGQKPWAIAYFRKALFLEPDSSQARQGLKFVQSQLAVKEIPHRLENYEFIREIFLLPVEASSYLWLLAVLIFLCGWSFLGHLGARRRALENDRPFPTFPWMSILSGGACLVFSFLAGLKLYDLQIPRGTIVEEKVAAQSAPGENQLNLFDLHGGFEVIIRNQSDDWVQVTYPGAMTGWIKKSSIFVTSGGPPW